MERGQELEWLEAQKIAISEDLVAAAKQQLRFLAAVDRRRWLYDGPLLDRAIRRYKTCWLPLLAKHTDSRVVEGSLVVPLDCEWIWHCHRLNPVQYKSDCEKLFGRILDNQNVESSLQEKTRHQTAEIWATLYPEEPFDLEYSCLSSDKSVDVSSGAEESIKYDLVSAVRRQSSFYYQVSRPSMHDNRILEAAVARYRGFLHLIRRNQGMSMKRFCVPTYDIDLMWHSHQLHPLSYCNDLVELLGKVLEHDDTDSDRTKGNKLDVGFYETTKQWEDTYGLRYWRAGSMYRGSLPTPLVDSPYSFSSNTKKEITSYESQNYLALPQTMVMEVLLEIVGVRNLPENHERNLFVSFSKKQPDLFFSGSCTLSILSEAGEKQVAGFECEPTGELTLALISDSVSNMAITNPAKTIGTTSISLQDLKDPNSKLYVEDRLELKPQPGNIGSKPVYLHVAASFTVPVPAPRILSMVKSHPVSTGTCFFPLRGKAQQIKSWTHFVDDYGKKIISLQMRNLEKRKDGRNAISGKEVVGITKLSRTPRLLAVYAKNRWSIKDINLSLTVEKKTSQDDHIFELNGDRQIKAFLGKKLEHEPKCCKEPSECDSITFVEFSAENPYGKSVALFDMKSRLIEVNEEWFVLTGVVLAFILFNMLKKEEFIDFITGGENVKTGTSSVMKVDEQKPKDVVNSSPAAKAVVIGAGSAAIADKSSGCGSGCSGKCGAAAESGGCGSGCGGGCRNVLSGDKFGGCGAGCGGGCGSGCGSMMKSNNSGGCGSGCGGGCGGGCGSVMKQIGSAGCGSGGGCGGGCGSILAGGESGTRVN